MKNNFRKLLYLGICIIIAVVIVVLVVIFSNKDYFADKCPETCSNGYICPPGCIDCAPSDSPSPPSPSPPGPSPPGPSPPGPSPPSPSPPSPSGDFNLVDKLQKNNNKLVCVNNQCINDKYNSLIKNIAWDPTQVSTFNFEVNTNIFIIQNNNDLQKITKGINSINSNFHMPVNCNIGNIGKTPVTILLNNSNITYDFSSISNILNRYFVIIFGLIDNIKLKGLNLGPNNGCGQSNWSNSCDNNFIYGGSGVPGFMRDCTIKGVFTNNTAPQEYLFYNCNFENDKIFKNRVVGNSGPYTQYIFGFLNCKLNDSTDLSTLEQYSCSSEYNCKNKKTTKYGGDYNNTNVTYKDDNLNNKYYIYIDSNGVYKCSNKDHTKTYYTNNILINYDDLENLKKQDENTAYILPGGIYYIKNPIVIPENCILYGLGFVIIEPSFTKPNQNFVVDLNNNSGIINCIIDSPLKTLNTKNILNVSNNECIILNTHCRIITYISKPAGLNNNGNMLLVSGKKNYIENSWLWISDHSNCNGVTWPTYDIIGLNLMGDDNINIGMFIEHQKQPIVVSGNGNKLIWTQGEGDYNTGTEYYLTINDSVKSFTYVMAGIYTIVSKIKNAIIKYDTDIQLLNKCINNNDITDIKNILIQDILITGWPGNADNNTILEYNSKKYITLSSSPNQALFYICNLADIIKSI